VETFGVWMRSLRAKTILSQTHFVIRSFWIIGVPIGNLDASECANGDLNPCRDSNQDANAHAADCYLRTSNSTTAIAAADEYA
jgi:hypothetical protein